MLDYHYIWNSIHYLAYQYPCHPTDLDKLELVEFVRQLSSPRWNFNYLIDYVKHHPIELYYHSGSSVFKYFFDLHNYINFLLNKPIFEYHKALYYYSQNFNQNDNYNIWQLFQERRISKFFTQIACRPIELKISKEFENLQIQQDCFSILQEQQQKLRQKILYEHLKLEAINNNYLKLTQKQLKKRMNQRQQQLHINKHAKINKIKHLNQSIISCLDYIPIINIKTEISDCQLPKIGQFQTLSIDINHDGIWSLSNLEHHWFQIIDCNSNKCKGMMIYIKNINLNECSDLQIIGLSNLCHYGYNKIDYTGTIVIGPIWDSRILLDYQQPPNIEYKPQFEIFGIGLLELGVDLYIESSLVQAIILNQQESTLYYGLTILQNDDSFDTVSNQHLGEDYLYWQFIYQGQITTGCNLCSQDDNKLKFKLNYSFEDYCYRDPENFKTKCQLIGQSILKSSYTNQ